MEVHTPDGQALDINDPALIERLCRGVDDKHQVSLIRSEHALTDSHPLSIFSLQTVEQLARETGIAIDKQRFRANVYIDLIEAKGFAENAFVGWDLRIGSEVIVSVQTPDRRCVVITLDPGTAEAEPSVLKRWPKITAMTPDFTAL